jgi:hypothetical protein
MEVCDAGSGPEWTHIAQEDSEGIKADFGKNIGAISQAVCRDQPGECSVSS